MELENSKKDLFEDFNNGEKLLSEQNKFMKTGMGRVFNTTLDVGIKMILPNCVEDEVIEIKNTILDNGMKEGIKKAVDSVIDFGKNINNIITGKFEDIEQVKETIKKGGFIDKIDSAFKDVIKFTKDKEIISKEKAKKLEEGKKVLMDTLSKNIKEEFAEQVKSGNKIEKYIENWKKYYEEKNLKGMEKELKKIEKESKNVMPFENTITKIEKITNIQNLIKSKNGDFNLSNIEKELIEKLNK